MTVGHAPLAHQRGSEARARWLSAGGDAGYRRRLDEPFADTAVGSGAEDTIASGSGAAAQPTMPARIGRFAVLSKLGQGGMGIVYAAYDEELDRRVALKVLRKSSETHVARMRREAQAMAKLSHPNVAQVYEVGTWQGQLHIAIEFVKGQTLGEWCRAADRTVDEIVALLGQAGEGLQAAHDAGLVHRDFKPDNMMVGDDGRVRVLDFGLAGVDGSAEPTDLEAVESKIQGLAGPTPLESPLTETGTLMGTPAYMSPEQFASMRVGPASDQFSFAATLYEALYGERPFAGDSVLSLGLNVSTGNVRPAPAGSAVPPPIRRALLKALDPEPEKRHADIRALLAEMGALGVAPDELRTSEVLPTVGIAAIGWAVGLYVPFEYVSRRPPQTTDAAELDRAAALLQPAETALIIVVVAIVGVLAAWFSSTWARRLRRRGRSRTMRQLRIATLIFAWVPTIVASLFVIPVLLLATTSTDHLARGALALPLVSLSAWPLFRVAAPLAAATGSAIHAVKWAVVAGYVQCCLIDSAFVGPGMWGATHLDALAIVALPTFLGIVLAFHWIPSRRPDPRTPALRLTLLGALLAAAASRGLL